MEEINQLADAIVSRMEKLIREEKTEETTMLARLITIVTPIIKTIDDPIYSQYEFSAGRWMGVRDKQLEQRGVKLLSSIHGLDTVETLYLGRKGLFVTETVSSGQTIRETTIVARDMTESDAVVWIRERSLDCKESSSVVLSVILDKLDRMKRRMAKLTARIATLRDVNDSTSMPYDPPSGFREVVWGSVAEGDIVFIYGAGRYSSKVYGPYVVHDTNRRELRSSGVVFPFPKTRMLASSC